MAALAHNFVHSNCGKPLPVVCTASHDQRRPFFHRRDIVEINQWLNSQSASLRTILSTENVYKLAGASSCCPTSLLPDACQLAPGAGFLRKGKIPLRINVLCIWKSLCAQFYPQNLCRTVLAALLATCYIAEFVSNCQEFTCSPLFKPQAGPSGRC